jgi:hypothetical protein
MDSREHGLAAESGKERVCKLLLGTEGVLERRKAGVEFSGENGRGEGELAEAEQSCVESRGRVACLCSPATAKFQARSETKPS